MKRIGVIAAACVCLASLVIAAEETVRTSASVSAGPYTVVLDAGHGGPDGGTVGRSGTVEKDINLKIALRTYDFLEFLGIGAVLTRDGDYSLHSEDAVTLRQKKTEDLKRRVLITKETENAFYVAIHQNFFQDRRSRGTQVFYARGSDESQAAARRLQAFCAGALGQGEKREAAKAPLNNYIMKNITCPGVIVECGFLSHPEEEMLLCSPEYQAKLSFVLAVGIAEIE